ncbi:major facilitator superfamily MFS_1 [Nitrobacter hamburgensis X14]|uniref:Major facilitator superfamily MFS_1 n=1 Tax=Nitrobacter hamburgensis (strain DSM 10229 / NCIMB 13809 / X14) TaxID=323097 RepID=Q1QHX4_NITHX|nr:MFS transporter [Nitrobacter hamburgensis]ABE64173.1 major facilitator superfamily MFS_1 [Nitrobacter hamburgensis X14]
MEHPVVGVNATDEPQGNSRVLFISTMAFSLGFAIWGMFSALAPFLIEWYHFTSTQVLVLAAMEPLFAAAISIPLGIWTDKYGGRTVFTILLVCLSVVLICGTFAEGYYSFLFLGSMLGLGGATFVVGNAHVSCWYPKSRQGMALGLFALGNIGITVGMVAVTFIITSVVDPNDPEGWRIIFPIFAIPTLLMAAIYMFFTSDPPNRKLKNTSMREIFAVYRSGVIVWLVPGLYWVAFGTLVFFASMMPTYLVDYWHVDATSAVAFYTPVLVVCVAITRPLGGWLADRYDVLSILSWMFGVMSVLAVLMALQISLSAELFAFYGLALLSGAAAAAVIKLIPIYFEHVGAVSGLAKAAGAACGFTMTAVLAASNFLLGGYTLGFVVWALMNMAAFYVSFSRVGFRDAKPLHGAIAVAPAH